MIFCFRTSFPVLEHPFPVLERLFPVLEHLFPVLERRFPVWNVFFLFWNALFLVFCSFGKVILSRDGTGQRSLSRDICSCPCPGTKGHRDKNFLLSRDKGTTGRPVPVCPGTSRGTSRSLETLDWTDKFSVFQKFALALACITYIFIIQLSNHLNCGGPCDW